MKSLVCIIVLLLALFACDTGKFSEVPENRFIGTWELQGRGMLEGVRVKIARNEDGDLEGRVVQRNDNKYVQFFVDSNAVLMTGIERRSNFEFTLSENKVGHELLGAYDVETETAFAAQFLDRNTIVLTTAANTSNIKASKVRYVRVE